MEVNAYAADLIQIRFPTMKIHRLILFQSSQSLTANTTIVAVISKREI